MVSLSYRQNHFVRRLARIGLTAKGVVYLALGALAFMAAFELSGHQENEATKAGVLQWLQNTAGSFVLMLIAIGLACYCAWRFAQAFTSNGVHKKWPERGRYLLSGLAYTSVAITAATLALHRDNNNGGDQNQYWIASLLEKPMGMVLVGIGAIILAVIGIYQLYYGYSEKFRKHVEGLDLVDTKSRYFMRMGKIGYIARGLVWLLLAFLMGRAALHNNAAEAGDTSKAFRLVENESYGSYILGAIGLGLIAYGIFSFIRARYEEFRNE